MNHSSTWTVKLSHKGFLALTNLHDIKNICEEELGEWLGANETVIPERLIPFKTIWLLAIGDESVSAPDEAAPESEDPTCPVSDAERDEALDGFFKELATYDKVSWKASMNECAHCGKTYETSTEGYAYGYCPDCKNTVCLYCGGAKGRCKCEEHLEQNAPLSLAEVVKSGDFVILDTETTGLHQGAEICQLAIVDSRGKTLLNTLVKPRRAIPIDATRIHGIDNNDVLNAPTFPTLLRDIVEILAGRNVVVYNAKFDRGMMHKSAEAWGMEKMEWKEISSWWCAMEAFAPIYGEWNAYHENYRWQPLSKACRYYDMVIEDAHTALGDCLATLELVKRMYPAEV